MASVEVSARGEQGARHPLPRGLKRLGWGLLAAFVVVFLVQNHAEIPAAWQSLRRARPAFVSLAAFAMGLWLVNLAFLHAATQRAAGLPSRPRALLGTAAAGNFLNLVTKSGGMAGLPMFLRHGRRRDRSAGRVTAAYLLTTVLSELAFAATLALALIVVWFDGHLTRAEVVAGIVFTVYLGVRIALVVVAARSRAAVRALYSLPHRVWSRVTRRMEAPGAEPDHRSADELYDALLLVRRRPRPAAGAFVHALLVEAIGIAELWAVMAAVGAGRSLVTAVIAYSLSVLFAIVGFLPGGLGFVEVSLGAALVSFGATAATATAAVVLYRLFEMWLPIVLGALAARAARHDEVRSC